MSEPKQCPKCSTALPVNAPESLCSACLLELALAPQDEDLPGSDAVEEPVPLLRKFGEFELLERLGSGGMGVVYRARQPRLNRLVALKLVKNLDPLERDFAERFRIEAQATGSLDHPHIVPVFESGEIDGQPFIAMRLIEGRPLEAILLLRAMEPRLAAQLMLKVALAVHYAHQHGVLHRDLKPGNILVDEDGDPHLTDFGLARLVQNDSSLTSTLASLGTPSYMSPEQAAGGTAGVTVAGDVYGLGAVLFETLTGAPPFAGGSTYETVKKVIEEEPRRPSSINSRIPPDLETICLKCLEKEPQRRYSSARDVAEDLRRWLNDEPILARPATVPERVLKWVRRKPLLAALLLLVVLGTGAFVLEQRRSSNELRIQRDHSLLQQQRAEATSRRLRFEEADRHLQQNKPDQALALFAQLVRQEPPDSVAANRIVSLLTHRNFPLLRSNWLVGTQRLNSLDLHPDGRRILVTSPDARARQWNLERGVEEPLAFPKAFRPVLARYNRAGTRMISADDKGCVIQDLGADRSVPLKGERMELLYAEFSPDDRRVLTCSFDGSCRIWDASSGELVQSWVHRLRVTMARFDPTGSQVASVSSDGFLKIVNLTSPDAPAQERSVASEQTTICWSPDGQHLAAQESGYESISILDAKTLQPVIGPLQHADVINAAEFDATGARIVTASDDRTARVWDARTGRPITEPMPHPAPVKGARFSRDGTRVITVCEDGRIRVWDVLNGQINSPVMPHSDVIQHAAVSPNGRWVASVSQDQVLRIWNARTTALAHPPIHHDNPLHIVSFSPDSSRIVVAEGSRITNGLDIVTGNSALVYDVISGELIRPPMSHERHLLAAQFDRGAARILTGSVDGTARLWSLDETQPEALCILGNDNPGNREKISSARLSPGGTLAVLSFEYGRAEVWNIENVKSPRLEATLHHDHRRVVRWADFDPAGSRVISTSDDHTARIWSLRNPTNCLILPHDHIVHGGHFSADGSRVITFSVDKTARLWDAATGKLLVPPMRHADQVWSAQFSPDGARLVTVTWLGEARLWDIQTGLALSEPLGGGLRRRPYIPQPDNARFTPDGQRLLCLFGDNTARLVEVPRFSAPVPPWLADLAEAVAGLRVDENGRTEQVSAESIVSFSNRVARAEMPQSATPDPWQAWLSWFLADRGTRPQTTQ